MNHRSLIVDVRQITIPELDSNTYGATFHVSDHQGHYELFVRFPATETLKAKEWHISSSYIGISVVIDILMQQWPIFVQAYLGNNELTAINLQ